ncbi:MAG: hypothetical protein WDW38_011013 [Sanguina aurantia]
MLVDFKDAVSASVALAAMRNYRLDLDQESSMLLRPVYGQPPLAPQSLATQSFNGAVDNRRRDQPPSELSLDGPAPSQVGTDPDDMQVESPGPVVLMQNGLSRSSAGPVMSSVSFDGRQGQLQQQPGMQQQQPGVPLLSPPDRSWGSPVGTFQSEGRLEPHAAPPTYANSQAATAPPTNPIPLHATQSSHHFAHMPPHLRPATLPAGQPQLNYAGPDKQAQSLGGPLQPQSAPINPREGAPHPSYTRQDLHMQHNQQQQQSTGGQPGTSAVANQGYDDRGGAPAFQQQNDLRVGQSPLYPGQFPQSNLHPHHPAQGPMAAQHDPRTGAPAQNDPRGNPNGSQSVDPRQNQFEQPQRGPPPPQQHDGRTLQQPNHVQQPSNPPYGRQAELSGQDQVRGREGGPWDPPLVAPGPPPSHSGDPGLGHQRRFAHEQGSDGGALGRGGPSSGAPSRNGGQGGSRAVESPSPRGGAESAAARQTAPPRRGSSREPESRGGGGDADTREDRGRRERYDGPSSGDQRDGRSGQARGGARDNGRDNAREYRAPSRNGRK